MERGQDSSRPGKEQKERGREGREASSEQAILVVSFGTSYDNSRELTVGAIEKAIARKFPDYEVRRAFTSQVIINILKKREGLEIDNVKEALERAAADGVKILVVQPTHLMAGYEYRALVNRLKAYEDRFEKAAIGSPLLSADEDFCGVIKAIVERTASYDDGETALCFVGHGTGADSNGVYARLQDKLTEEGYGNYYIGTVEAEPSLNTVTKALRAHGGYKRVVLEPLMVVAGDHANHDMAGDEEDSWRSVLEKEGYEVECVMEGLGQIKGIQDIYGRHAEKAIQGLAR